MIATEQSTNVDYEFEHFYTINKTIASRDKFIKFIIEQNNSCNGCVQKIPPRYQPEYKYFPKDCNFGPQLSCVDDSLYLKYGIQFILKNEIKEDITVERILIGKIRGGYKENVGCNPF